jgi:hypothetical protein
MISISESIGSSTHVAPYSGSQPRNGGKAWLVIFTVEPLLMPTHERCFQR